MDLLFFTIGLVFVIAGVYMLVKWIINEEVGEHSVEHVVLVTGKNIRQLKCDQDKHICNSDYFKIGKKKYRLKKCFAGVIGDNCLVDLDITSNKTVYGRYCKDIKDNSEFKNQFVILKPDEGELTIPAICMNYRGELMLMRKALGTVSVKLNENWEKEAETDFDLPKEFSIADLTEAIEKKMRNKSFSTLLAVVVPDSYKSRVELKLYNYNQIVAIVDKIY